MRRVDNVRPTADVPEISASENRPDEAACAAGVAHVVAETGAVVTTTSEQEEPAMTTLVPTPIPAPAANEGAAATESGTVTAVPIDVEQSFAQEEHAPLEGAGDSDCRSCPSDSEYELARDDHDGDDGDGALLYAPATSVDAPLGGYPSSSAAAAAVDVGVGADVPNDDSLLLPAASLDDDEGAVRLPPLAPAETTPAAVIGVATEDDVVTAGSPVADEERPADDKGAVVASAAAAAAGSEMTSGSPPAKHLPKDDELEITGSTWTVSPENCRPEHEVQRKVNVKATDDSPVGEKEEEKEEASFAGMSAGSPELRRAEGTESERSAFDDKAMNGYPTEESMPVPVVGTAAFAPAGENEIVEGFPTEESMPVPGVAPERFVLFVPSSSSSTGRRAQHASAGAAAAGAGAGARRSAYATAREGSAGGAQLDDKDWLDELIDVFAEKCNTCVEDDAM